MGWNTWYLHNITCARPAWDYLQGCLFPNSAFQLSQTVMAILVLPQVKQLKNDFVTTAQVQCNKFLNIYMVQVITASSDASIRVWDAKTCDCVQAFRPPQAGTDELAINNIHVNPQNLGQIIVCNDSSTAFLMTMQGQVRQYEVPNSWHFVTMPHGWSSRSKQLESPSCTHVSAFKGQDGLLQEEGQSCM